MGDKKGKKTKAKDAKQHAVKQAQADRENKARQKPRAADKK